MTDDYDAFQDSQFTAEISKRMRVPDRLLLIDDAHNGYVDQTSRKETSSSTPDLHRMMQVPDRILVAGGNTHVSSKRSPIELQLENSVLPPTMEQVRVNTPPRTIRLEDHAFPTVDPDEEPHEYHNSPFRSSAQFDRHAGGQQFMQRSGSVESEGGQPIITRSESMSAGFSGVPRENLTPWEELQLVRRQIAKLNHRLMALELENQQQQQRETILTVVMSVYFIGKFFLWMHRSL